MNLRPFLPLLALVIASPALAQNDATIDVVSPHREEAHDPNEPFTIVEEMPEFPGGQEALFAYIGKALKYPEEAVEAGIEGVVYITFVVEADGTITGAKVIRGIGGGCDEEAVRVVGSMPNWKPGKQRGKAVRVQYNLPLRFKLASNKEKK